MSTRQWIMIVKFMAYVTWFMLRFLRNNELIEAFRDELQEELGDAMRIKAAEKV